MREGGLGGKEEREKEREKKNTNMHMPKRFKLDPSKGPVPVYSVKGIEGTNQAKFESLGKETPRILDKYLLKVSYDNKDRGGLRLNLYQCFFSEADFVSGIGMNIPILQGVISNEVKILGFVYYFFNWRGKESFMNSSKTIQDLIGTPPIKGYFSIFCYIPVYDPKKNQQTMKIIQQQLWKRMDKYPGEKKSMQQMFNLTGLHLNQFGGCSKEMVITESKNGTTSYQWVPLDKKKKKAKKVLGVFEIGSEI